MNENVTELFVIKLKKLAIFLQCAFILCHGWKWILLYNHYNPSQFPIFVMAQCLHMSYHDPGDRVLMQVFSLVITGYLAKRWPIMFKMQLRVLLVTPNYKRIIGVSLTIVLKNELERS